MSDVSTVQAAILNIRAYKGDTFALALTIKEDNVAIDVSTYDFKMQVREQQSETSAVVMTFINADGIDMTDAATGQILLTKTAAEMEIPVRKYYYDLQYNNAGVIKTILVGSFIVQLEITT